MLDCTLQIGEQLVLNTYDICGKLDNLAQPVGIGIRMATVIRLERKRLKETCMMWGALSLFLLIISVVILEQTGPMNDSDFHEMFKFGKIISYIVAMGFYFYSVFKTTVSYLKFKDTKI